MSASWLEVHGPGGVRQVPLREGRSRVGGKGTDIELEGVSGGELHVWSDPPKALYVGSDPGATPPMVGGRALDEVPLRPGTVLEWGPYRLVYGGRAAATDLAELEEIDAPRDPAAAGELYWRMGRRVAAGALVEAGMAERKALRRWQEAVLAGTFEPEGCATELLPDPLPPELARRLQDRAGTLLRDFLMVSRQTGVRGAARRVRERTRSLVAYLVVQAGVFLLFALILAACMLVLRMHRGVSFDALLDRLLPG